MQQAGIKVETSVAKVDDLSETSIVVADVSAGNRLVSSSTSSFKPPLSPNITAPLLTRGPITAPAEDLTEKERPPPPEATPLDFPCYSPRNATQRLDRGSLRHLSRLLVDIRKPQDVSEGYLRALNLQVEREVPLAEILPEGSRQFFRPSKIDTDKKPTESAPLTGLALSNGHPPPDDGRYEAIKQELLLENDTAFREVSRLPPRPGREKPRLTLSRRFWMGLERMSQYWDASVDHMYEVPDEPAPHGKDSENSSALEARNLVDEKNAEEPSASAESSEKEKQMELDHPITVLEKDSQMEVDPPPPSTRPTTRLVYKGRRIGRGADMPEDCRDETVRRFVEMIAWLFHCQVKIPEAPPRLSVGSILFPVRHSFVVGRSPQAYELARRNILEGPLLGVQCRGETKFHTQSPGLGKAQGPKSEQSEVLDLIREVGGMILLAQERAREGSTEKRVGEGQWWTTVPRWGGGPGGEVELASPANTEIPAAGVGEEKKPAAEPESRTRSQPPSPVDRPASKRPKGAGGGTAGPKRMTMAERWKVVQPGPSGWDRKMTYRRVGKDPRSDFDDIFFVSSINHHISILRLPIHADYLDWLADSDTSYSTAPNMGAEVEPPPKHILDLQRTRWFDLFNAEDRLEAVEGLRALMAWLMRAS